jgi:hypothetical protein
VIDTVGVRTDRPFAMVDMYGTPYTEAVHVVERFIGCSTMKRREKGWNEPQRKIFVFHRIRFRPSPTATPAEVGQMRTIL